MPGSAASGTHGTYIKITKNSYCVMSGFYMSEISFVQFIGLYLRVIGLDIQKCKCYLYCRFCGKFMSDSPPPPSE